MHSAVQTAVVTIICYKPLSGLNFARYTGQYGSYMPSSPLGVYKPLLTHVMGQPTEVGCSFGWLIRTLLIVIIYLGWWN